MIILHACVVDIDGIPFRYLDITETGIHIIDYMSKYLIIACSLVEMEDDEMVVLKILTFFLSMALLKNDLLHEAYRVSTVYIFGVEF